MGEYEIKCHLLLEIMEMEMCGLVVYPSISLDTNVKIVLFHSQNQSNYFFNWFLPYQFIVSQFGYKNCEHSYRHFVFFFRLIKLDKNFIKITHLELFIIEKWSSKQCYLSSELNVILCHYKPIPQSLSY